MADIKTTIPQSGFLQVALVITATLLLLAIAPLPYGYYKFLRLVSFAVFGWACFLAFVKPSIPLAALLGLAALVFNPIFPVYLSKQIWMVLDAAAAALALGSALILHRTEK